MSLRDASLVPDKEQYALIGEAISAWGIVEHHTTAVLARLAGCPDFTGLALVERLGFLARMQAMDSLIDMHRRRYGCQKLSEDVLAEAEQILRRLRSEKEKRNRYAHDIWLRLADEQVMSLRMRGRQYRDETRDGAPIMSNADLQKDIDDAAALIGLLEALLERLPEVPEMPSRP